MDLDSREASLSAPRCGLRMFPLGEFFTYLPRLPTRSPRLPTRSTDA